MYWFLFFLILGFACNLASSFTGYYSEKWGRQTGTFITILLRDIFGIPVWALGFLLAVRDSGKLLYNSTLPVTLTGWILIIAGGIIIITALVSIRVRAAAPSEGDSLVDTGIYSVVRHPIHCGTFLEFTGLVILWPSLTVGIAFILGTIWIFIQSKAEERDLKKRIHGYAEYMERVRGFMPLKKSRKNTMTDRSTLINGTYLL